MSRVFLSRSSDTVVVAELQFWQDGRGALIINILPFAFVFFVRKINSRTIESNEGSLLVVCIDEDDNGKVPYSNTTYFEKGSIAPMKS